MTRSMRKMIGWGGLILYLLSLLMPYGLVFAESGAGDPVQKLIDSLPDNPVKNLPDEPVEKKDLNHGIDWELLDKLPEDDRQALLNAWKNQQRINLSNQSDSLLEVTQDRAYIALKGLLYEFGGGGAAALTESENLGTGYTVYGMAFVRGLLSLVGAGIEDETTQGILQGIVDDLDYADKLIILKDSIKYAGTGEYWGLSRPFQTFQWGKFKVVLNDELPIGPLGRFVAYVGVPLSAFEFVAYASDAMNQPAFSEKQAESILGAGASLGSGLMAVGALTGCVPAVAIGTGIWIGCYLGKILIQFKPVRDFIKSVNNVVTKIGEGIIEGVKTVGRGIRAAWNRLKSLF